MGDQWRRPRAGRRRREQSRTFTVWLQSGYGTTDHPWEPTMEDHPWEPSMEGSAQGSCLPAWDPRDLFPDPILEGAI